MHACIRNLNYAELVLAFKLLFGVAAALLFIAIGADSKWNRAVYTVPVMIAHWLLSCFGDFHSSTNSVLSIMFW